MHRTIALAGLAFPLLALAQSCLVTEKNLAGAWERSGRAGYFEQMEFTSESGVNVFNSWLHERPELLDGRWSLAKCTLQIFKPPSTTPEFSYKLSLTGKNKLRLSAMGDATATYRRMKSAP